ncbi:hypothetical protein [Streptomyces sp. MUSC 14]|uniref:hypothetical protein n=1 Tax=Streptomyces sp. MUSC 14 TaxID=1354889 RepID=UPI0035286C0E
MVHLPRLGPTEEVWTLRIRVLENADQDPFTRTWVERGRIRTAWETFSPDAATFKRRGTRYLVRAQHEPGMDDNTAPWIPRTVTPWTLTGRQVHRPTAEFDWSTMPARTRTSPANPCTTPTGTPGSRSSAGDPTAPRTSACPAPTP